MMFFSNSSLIPRPQIFPSNIIAGIGEGLTVFPWWGRDIFSGLSFFTLCFYWNVHLWGVTSSIPADICWRMHMTGFAFSSLSWYNQSTVVPSCWSGTIWTLVGIIDTPEGQWQGTWGTSLFCSPPLYIWDLFSPAEVIQPEPKLIPTFPCNSGRHIQVPFIPVKVKFDSGGLNSDLSST